MQAHYHNNRYPPPQRPHFTAFCIVVDLQGFLHHWWSTTIYNRSNLNQPSASTGLLFTTTVFLEFGNLLYRVWKISCRCHALNAHPDRHQLSSQDNRCPTPNANSLHLRFQSDLLRQTDITIKWLFCENQQSPLTTKCIPRAILAQQYSTIWKLSVDQVREFVYFN